MTKQLATRDFVNLAVSTHNLDITAHSNQIDILTTNIDNLSSDVSVLFTNIDSLSTVSQELSSNISNLFNITDSLSANIDILFTNTESLSTSVLSLSAEVDTKLNIDQTTQQFITGGPRLDYLDFNTTVTPGVSTEGRVRWNSTDGTLDLGMMNGLVTQQIGQELFIKVINKSGAKIENGSVVYFNGRQGNRPKIALARGDVEATSRVSGVVTEDINDGDEGFITTFGYVRQIKTNYAGWATGDRLWVSTTTAGALTNVEPSAPHHSDLVAEVDIVGGPGIGSIFVSIKPHITLCELSNINGTPVISSGQFPVWDNSRQVFDFNYNIETGKDPTGFDSITDTTLSFVPSALRFTITPTASSFNYYRNRKVITQVGAKSVTIPDVTGMYFVYFNDSDVLTASTTPWDFSNGKIFVAILLWNTQVDRYVITEERHGISMTWATHEYLHNTIGTRYKNGLAGAFTNSSFTIDTGIIYDEDLKHEITPQTQTRLFYKNGAATFEWTNPQSSYYYTSGGNLYYNNGNNLASVTSNHYMAVWVFATNSIDYPIITVLGQRTDTTLANARTNNTYESLSLNGLPFAEFKVLYRVLLRNDATPYEETQDLRSISNIPAGTYVATDHNTLTNIGVNTHAEIDAALTALSASELHTKTFVLTNPIGSISVPLWRVPRNTNIYDIHVLCTGGTSIVGQWWQYDINGIDGSAMSTSITASSGINVNSTINAVATAGNYIGWVTNTVNGVVPRVVINVDYI